MRSFVRIIPIIALFAVNVPVATAQSVDSSRATPSCDRDSTIAGSYKRCALWTDGRALKRGVPGEEVSHVHFVTPLALSRFVMGDSARVYALSYERNAQRGLALRFGAAGLIAAGVVAAIPRPCHAPKCIGSHPTSMNMPLIAGGVVLEIASLSLRSRAAKARTQAVSWHNALFAR